MTTQVEVGKVSAKAIRLRMIERSQLKKHEPDPDEELFKNTAQIHQQPPRASFARKTVFDIRRQ